MTFTELLLLFAALLLAAACSACLTSVLRPLLQRYALARPNARSSHRVPTPQGAGIAVIVATLAVGTIIIAASASASNIPLMVFGATLFIGLVGIWDDIKTIPVLPRLILQALAVAAVLFASSGDLRIVPECPLWLERCLLLLAGLWFVNLVNFMDGLDWMTVAEVVPVTAALLVLGYRGDVPAPIAFVAATLCGAMLGFAPFNRPIAKVFLGDVGSLPIGLLLGWCLLQLAWHQQLAAALLLPLYYLADATMTLFRRIAKREPFWAAHRSHYYQRATDNGFTVLRVVGEVFALNIVLAALAFASAIARSMPISMLSILIGALAVMGLLYRFSQKQPT
jgi:UDP-N-acetylmuramyl pentapeptide phosphotransferase/UDP-N-acetylglucosamine-1-phosphate transferase